MILNWYVFSDLHLQYNGFKTDMLRNSLLNFLESNKKETDFILISGDCFYKNNSSDIQETVDFIHKLCSACTCYKSNLYITPGNHDLKRTKTRLKVLEQYTGIDYTTGKMVKDEKEVDKEAIANLFSSFYFEDFFKLYELIKGKGYESVHQLTETANYRILNINTCVLSGGYCLDKEKQNEKLDEGRLSVLDSELPHECNKIKPDGRINIAFMHHGISYLRQSEQQLFEQLMEDSNIDIIFSGHSHNIDIITYNNTSSQLKQFTCGAPIVDSFSYPSFYKCNFDTDTKKVCLKLYSYDSSARKWQVCHSVRLFEDGEYVFSPKRFEKQEIIHTNKSFITSSNTHDIEKKHFNEFGIIDAIPYREFISLRKKLIKEAKGNVIIVGQSLESAFDKRKDSESIVDVLKNNKNIENIDIFLTDPLLFDSYADNSTCYGDTPINRIASTMHTLLDDIACSLNQNQSMHVYFIPLVQLDHMVFVNDILLLRHTLLWTNDSHYKATPLVCKKVDSSNVSESIYNSSMYNVYNEYIQKLKDDCIVIDINENIRKKSTSEESLAKNHHIEWRKTLYNLINSHKLKGKIVMHKLYRTQLISDLHSTWDNRFRSFSKEINWRDEIESSYFISGSQAIKHYKDLYNVKNLLNDSTQKILLPYIENTEKLLNNLVKKYDNDAVAKIFPSLNLGITSNVLRLAGGFATGMLVVWKCGTPIVPIDTTVNVCSSSYYQFEPSSLKNVPLKKFFNSDKITNIIQNGSIKEGIAFSFTTGNHFLILCHNRKNNMYYLILHSSAKQFKDTYLGLYPRHDNWYSSFVKKYKDDSSNRYINYLKDEEAERFISIAKMLNKENEDIHNWFAKQFCNGIHFTNHKTYHHYSMPTEYSIAIGTYVIDENDIVPIFSKEGYPICLFKPNPDMWGIELQGKKKYIIPHGWGEKIDYNFFESLDNDKELSECTFTINNSKLALENNNHIVESFSYDYKNRFSEKMIDVRDLKFNEKKNQYGIIDYNSYMSGEIIEILEPIALYSKNNENVKYYVNEKIFEF